MKTRLIAFAILVLFGIVRMPIEAKLEKEQRALHYHGSQLNLDVRQRVGQLGFVAALSGFRSLVADMLYIESLTAWQRVEWGRLKVLFDAMTSLEPRNVTFWDMGGYHMAYNASVNALNDPSQPREALRLRAQREYWKLGEDFFLRGIQNNPDRAFLYEQLALVYRDKFKDHEKASAMYDEACKRADARMYTHRFAVYELAKVPGREKEAYARLKALYEMGEDEHLPTLLTLIPQLEEKLNVPKEQRIYIPPAQTPK